MVGFGVILFNVTAISLIQAITPDRMLGRANASRRFVVWGVIPVGGLVGGALGSTIGLRETMFIGSIGSLLRGRADPALADPLGREDVRARGSVCADRLREQRAGVALPRQVRLRTQPREPVAHRRQPLRLGGEPGERVLELVARSRARRDRPRPPSPHARRARARGAGRRRPRAAARPGVPSPCSSSGSSSTSCPASQARPGNRLSPGPASRSSSSSRMLGA